MKLAVGSGRVVGRPSRSDGWLRVSSEGHQCRSTDVVTLVKVKVIVGNVFFLNT